VGGEVVPAEALRKLSGLSGSSSESEGITNAQLRKVDIDFGGINGFTTMVAVHFLGRNTYRCILLA
jgi:hypothetical protein